MYQFMKWSLLDDFKLFFTKILYLPAKKLGFQIANTVGIRFAAPRKYFQKELNDKQIFKLGAPVSVLKNGNIVYKKSFMYKFNGKQRTTDVYTNLT